MKHFIKNWLSKTDKMKPIVSALLVAGMLFAVISQLVVPAQAQSSEIERFILASPVYMEEASLGTAQADLELPAALEAEMKDGSTQSIPVTWSCESYDPQMQGEYIFSAQYAGYTYDSEPPYAMIRIGAPMRLFAGSPTGFEITRLSYTIATGNSAAISSNGTSLRNYLTLTDANEVSAVGYSILWRAGTNEYDVGEVKIDITDLVKGSALPVPMMNGFWRIEKDTEADKTYLVNNRMIVPETHQNGQIVLVVRKDLSEYATGVETSEAVSAWVGESLTPSSTSNDVFIVVNRLKNDYAVEKTSSMYNGDLLDGEEHPENYCYVMYHIGESLKVTRGLAGTQYVLTDTIPAGGSIAAINGSTDLSAVTGAAITTDGETGRQTLTYTTNAVATADVLVRYEIEVCQSGSVVNEVDLTVTYEDNDTITTTAFCETVFEKTEYGVAKTSEKQATVLEGGESYLYIAYTIYGEIATRGAEYAQSFTYIDTLPANAQFVSFNGETSLPGLSVNGREIIYRSDTMVTKDAPITVIVKFPLSLYENTASGVVNTVHQYAAFADETVQDSQASARDTVGYNEYSISKFGRKITDAAELGPTDNDLDNYYYVEYTIRTERIANNGIEATEFKLTDAFPEPAELVSINGDEDYDTTAFGITVNENGLYNLEYTTNNMPPALRVVVKFAKSWFQPEVVKAVTNRVLLFVKYGTVPGVTYNSESIVSLETDASGVGTFKEITASFAYKDDPQAWGSVNSNIPYARLTMPGMQTPFSIHADASIGYYREAELTLIYEPLFHRTSELDRFKPAVQIPVENYRYRSVTIQPEELAYFNDHYRGYHNDYQGINEIVGPSSDWSNTFFTNYYGQVVRDNLLYCGENASSGRTSSVTIQDDELKPLTGNYEIYYTDPQGVEHLVGVYPVNNAETVEYPLPDTEIVSVRVTLSSQGTNTVVSHFMTSLNGYFIGSEDFAVDESSYMFAPVTLQALDPDTGEDMPCDYCGAAVAHGYDIISDCLNQCASHPGSDTSYIDYATWLTEQYKFHYGMQTWETPGYIPFTAKGKAKEALMAYDLENYGTYQVKAIDYSITIDGDNVYYVTSSGYGSNICLTNGEEMGENATYNPDTNMIENITDGFMVNRYSGKDISQRFKVQVLLPYGCEFDEIDSFSLNYNLTKNWNADVISQYATTLADGKKELTLDELSQYVTVTSDGVYQNNGLNYNVVTFDFDFTSNPIVNWFPSATREIDLYTINTRLFGIYLHFKMKLPISDFIQYNGRYIDPTGESNFYSTAVLTTLDVENQLSDMVTSHYEHSQSASAFYFLDTSSYNYENTTTVPQAGYITQDNGSFAIFDDPLKVGMEVYAITETYYYDDLYSSAVANNRFRPDDRKPWGKDTNNTMFDKSQVEWEDFNGNGSTDDVIVYDSRYLKLTPTSLAGAQGTSKSVSVDDGASYSKAPVDAPETVYLKGNYTYRLQVELAQESETAMNNIIIYDRLEKGADGDPSDWQGMFAGVDTSYVEATHNVDAKAYYSTNVNPGELYVAGVLNTADWTLIDENMTLDQKRLVKTVAFDLRKTKNNLDFQLYSDPDNDPLGFLERTYVEINMIAPQTLCQETPDCDHVAVNMFTATYTVGLEPLDLVSNATHIKIPQSIIALEKFDFDDVDNKLAGVELRVYAKLYDANGNNYYDTNNSFQIPYSYSNDFAITVTTDADGRAYLTNLENGLYGIQELRAQTGYGRRYDSSYGAPNRSHYPTAMGYIAVTDEGARVIKPTGNPVDLTTANDLSDPALRTSEYSFDTVNYENGMLVYGIWNKRVANSIIIYEWVELNHDGMNSKTYGDRPLTSNTVQLYDMVTGQLVTRDMYGNEMDSSATVYSYYAWAQATFDGLADGRYKVLSHIPELDGDGYELVPPPATPSSDRYRCQETVVINGEHFAVVDNITLNSSVGSYQPYSMQEYTGQTAHVDIPIEPKVEVEKTAQVNTDADATGTLAVPVQVDSGDTITYKIKVNNLGTLDNEYYKWDYIKDMTVSDVLPLGLTWVEGQTTSPAGGTYDEGSRTVTWADQDIAPGETVYSFRVTVDEPYDYFRYDNRAKLAYVDNEELYTNYTYHRKDPSPVNVTVSFRKLNGYGQGLSGAGFTLYACTNTAEGHDHTSDCVWSTVAYKPEALSNAEGYVSITAVGTSMAYKIVETTVPTGVTAPAAGSYIKLNVTSGGTYSMTGFGDFAAPSMVARSTDPSAPGMWQVKNGDSITTITVTKLISNYDDFGTALKDYEFIINLSGDVVVSTSLKHNETSKTITHSVEGDSDTVNISEIVPMEFDEDYAVSAVITRSGGTLNFTTDTLEIMSGDVVAITVTNTFNHEGYFKARAWVENAFD